MNLEEYLEELKIAVDCYGSFADIPQEEACKLMWELAEIEDLTDDLIFFVSKSSDKRIQVCRREKQNHPSLEIVVDWVSSLALNFLCQIRYSLRICTCSYVGEGEFRGVSKLIIRLEANKQLYATPIQAQVDTYYQLGSDSSELDSPEFSFPQIYFSVQDFESCFKDMRIGQGDVLVVELVAQFRKNEVQANSNNGVLESDSKNYYKKIDEAMGSLIFQGAIGSDALYSAYEKNVRELDWQTRGAFILMNGPDGYGEAQVHISDTEFEKEKNEKNSMGALKKMKKFFKDFIESSDEECAAMGSVSSGLACRLTFIRMHWIELLKLILSNKG